ncbi:MAG: hypothetical protein M3326_16215 [Actinomycetota bacterium]|nr:hypothetical protein [Actinomycetota bacterium]
MVTYCPRCGARFPDGLPTELLDAGDRRCAECTLTVTDPPAMLVRGDEDEVEYDLSEWETGERGLATATLVEADIPYRWEADLVLVVPGVAEAEVDQLLGELEAPEALDDGAEGDYGVDGGDGGDEAQSAMADLFVAVDRLQHDPADPDVAADVLYSAGAVSASSPPYGIDRPVWRRIQGLASTVVTDLEEAVDDETVAADARTLREYLRDLV